MKMLSTLAEPLEPLTRLQAGHALAERRDHAIQRFAKRLVDIVGAVFGLIVLSPVFAVVALAVWAKMGRPILFRQVRAGYHEMPFRLLKFRTMTDDRGPGGELRPDSERLTELGRFLRSSSLDELPQLVNVLTGDLSLVGPRPLPIRYLPRYTSRQRMRHQVRPGITGLAQINGRNQLDWESRLELDAKYCERTSIWLDFKILAATVREVALRRGAFDSGKAQEFWGTQGKPENSPDSYPVEENELAHLS
jgi:lipopolysaccharide/colanic/teichoic acid biosynthesis glycosyltransferase